MGGKNIGDLLNAKGVTWGAFMGGFDLTITNPTMEQPAATGQARRPRPIVARPPRITSRTTPFSSTGHQRPIPSTPGRTRVWEIGKNGPANHEYDIHDFFDALKVGNMPAVSFLKAIAAEDGHAGYSDPLLEQHFLVKTINTIMQVAVLAEHGAS